ncbi:MAG TPA: HAMP domain-containing sensor histidine kinase, partial [Dehalococcoidales bacterium]
MNSQINRTGSYAEYTPEEVALVMRLSVFVSMRWFAVLGVIIATLIASRVLHIGFPTLPIYVICAIMVVYNIVLLRQTQSLKTERTGVVIPKARTYSYIHIFLDMVGLAALLHFAGGIENPFIFFFLLHIILASIALPYRTVYILATSAIVVVLLLVGLEYAGVIPHNNLEGFAAPTLYQEGSYILAVLVALATLLYASTYMGTAISGELRKRQREVLELGGQLLAEKTKELEKSSREIAKLEEEKSRFLRFLGIAAHDLKAPLTAIQGFLWVMLGGYSGEISDKQRNMLERSTRRITDLLRLISDLLDIPRIETGQIVQEMKEISLAQIIEGCVDDVGNRAREKGLELRMELSQSLPKVNGSGARLQQVVTNLLDNAITYTADGAVTIRVSEKDTDIWIEVMDTGIGIAPEDLPQLFTDFFRGSRTEEKGTGLGLSIAKRIVEAHGG